MHEQRGSHVLRPAPRRSEETLSSQKPPQSSAASRRERREAERTSRKLPSQQKRPGWQSPFALVVAAVIVVAIAGVGFLFMNQSSGVSSATINTPSVFTPTDTANGQTVGKSDAKVKLAIWADFQCPGCGVFSRSIEPQIMTNYVQTGKASLTFKNYAFLDQGKSGQESHNAAVAALCASDQGKFWPYHDYLFFNQGGENLGQFNKDRLKAIANAIGLNAATFDSCTGSSAKLDQVNAEYQEGTTAGVNSTPTLFIGDEKYAGSMTYPAIAAAIDRVLAGGPVNPTPSPTAAASASTQP